MSITTSEKRAHRTPSLLVAAIPAVTLIVLLGGGYIAASLPVEPLLIASSVVAGIVAIALGYTWDEIIGAIAEKIAKTMPAVLILIVVGALIGTWMAGGTIPMLIYYGLKIINPKFLALIALVVTAIVSLCTGTSWGSAGTVGVAFMGVAVGMDANLPMVAGAIVAGAYFGDKLSPLSDTTNIASLATGVNLFTHIRHLMWTTVPAFLTSAVVYLIFGLQSSGGTVPEKVNTILATLDSAFNWNLFLLVPVLVVLVGSVMKFPTVPVMLVSCATAIFNAVVFQGVSFANSVVASVDGFTVDMVGKAGFQADSVIKDVTRLLERGGMNSMMSVLLICFCAIAFAGTVSVSGSLDVLISSLLAPVKSTFALIASTIVTGLAVIGITSNGQVSLLIPGEMLRGEYIKRGLHPKNLSRTIEDAATVWEPDLALDVCGRLYGWNSGCRHSVLHAVGDFELDRHLLRSALGSNRHWYCQADTGRTEGARSRGLSIQEISGDSRRGVPTLVLGDPPVSTRIRKCIFGGSDLRKGDVIKAMPHGHVLHSPTI